jgi:hypothetical protein
VKETDLAGSLVTPNPRSEAARKTCFFNASFFNVLVARLLAETQFRRQIGQVLEDELVR